MTNDYDASILLLSSTIYSSTVNTLKLGVHEMQKVLNCLKAAVKRIKKFVKKRKKLSIFLGIIIIFFVAIGSFMGGNQETAVRPTATVIQTDVEYRVKVNGMVRSVDEKTILAPIQGTIKTLNVKQGDLIEEGQLLALIDPTEINEKIEKARIELELEQARLKVKQDDKEAAEMTTSNLKQKYEHLKELYDSKLKLFQEGAISQQSLDEAKMEMDEAYSSYRIAQKEIEDGRFVQELSLQKSQLDLAQLNYQSLLTEKEKHYIKSPISGTVGEVFANEGELLVEEREFIYVVNNEEMEITANVSEYDARKIRIGDPVTITTDDGQKYETTVASISPYAKKLETSQGSESVVEIKAIISGKDTLLKSGFSVNVDILCDKKENVLAVPYETILSERDGTQYVFSSKEGVIKKHKIETGLEGSLIVEVTECDLKDGDLIIVNPTEDLLMQASNEKGTKK